MPRTRWLAITAAATLLLAIATATSAAGRFSTSEQNFRATFAEFQLSVSGVNILCRVTLEGSFHTRTIAKVKNALVGAITRGIVAHPCTNGEVWLDNGTERQPLGTAPRKLPFHLQYESFVGTLPSIVEFRLLLSRVSLVLQTTVLGITCRGRYGRVEDTIRAPGARTASGALSELILIGNVSLVEQLGPNAICPSPGRLIGIGEIVNLTNGGSVSITLI